MKKVLSFVLAGAMVLSLAACGDPGSTSGQAPGSAGSSTQVTEVTGLTEPIAETPALITSAGQSADASMLSAILEKAGFSCDIETSIGADSFDTSAYKTLIIGVGGSQKGLMQPPHNYLNAFGSTVPTSANVSTVSMGIPFSDAIWVKSPSSSPPATTSR